MSAGLLVIDDDERSCRLVRATFAAEGIDVRSAHDGPSGLDALAREQPEIVLLDLRLPGPGGFEVLETLRRRAPGIPVVMLTASRDLKDAVRAMQLGAFDYLTKPIDSDEIVVVVRRALQSRALQAEVEELREQVGKTAAATLAAQMGPSAAAARIVEQVTIVAASDFTVVISGETGTGKELVAQAIHHQSGRRQKPFVALDCGAIPEALLESELFGHERGAFTGADRKKVGQFQLAHGGTCFLDEIGNLPMTLQVKLLRALESRQVHAVGADRPTPIDVRFVAATNEDLQVRVAQGRFRADLYFRLAEYTITLPPLRERREDIPHLARRFLDETGLELRRPFVDISPEALHVLSSYAWPGNVRELRNVIRQAALQTTSLVIAPAAIRAALSNWEAAARTPPARGDGRSLRETAQDAARAAERQAICEALRAAGGNKAQAARVLRTDYKTLHVKMRQLGIRARDYGS